MYCTYIHDRDVFLLPLLQLTLRLEPFLSREPHDCLPLSCTLTIEKKKIPCQRQNGSDELRSDVKHQNRHRLGSVRFDSLYSFIPYSGIE